MSLLSAIRIASGCLAFFGIRPAYVVFILTALLDFPAKVNFQLVP